MTKKLLSKQIFKQSIKGNYVLWLSLTGVLTFFITVMTLMGSRMLENQSQGGFGGGRTSSLLTLYANGIFGMLGIMILIVFAIVVGNKLIASEVDKGTMSYTLNTPITRTQIVFSKMLFYVLSIFLLGATVGLFGTISIAIAGAEVALGTFWLLILGFVLYGFAIGGICFFASCFFNKSGNSIALGAGLSIAFFILNSLSAINDLEWLKYFTLNTLYDTSAIISGSGYVIQMIALFVIGAILYILGCNKFIKKDLPL
ncbi:MAG: hypothetical protein EOM55_02865 [Clostridia bacterium]|nr:hypothetical protein [Clostridia bacterium]